MRYDTLFDPALTLTSRRRKPGNTLSMPLTPEAYRAALIRGEEVSTEIPLRIAPPVRQNNPPEASAQNPPASQTSQPTPPARPGTPRSPYGTGIMRNADGSLRFMAGGKVSNFGASELQKAGQILPHGTMGNPKDEAGRQHATNHYIRDMTGLHGEDTSEVTREKNDKAWRAGADIAQADGNEISKAKILPGGQYAFASAPSKTPEEKAGLMREQAAYDKAAAERALSPAGRGAIAAVGQKSAAAPTGKMSEFYNSMQTSGIGPEPGAAEKLRLKTSMKTRSEERRIANDARSDADASLMRGEADKDRALRLKGYEMIGAKAAADEDKKSQAAGQKRQQKVEDDKKKAFDARRAAAMTAYEAEMTRGIGETSDAEGKNPKLDKDGKQTYRPFNRPGEQEDVRRKKLKEYGAWEQPDEDSYNLKKAQREYANTTDAQRKKKLGDLIRGLQSRISQSQ